MSYSEQFLPTELADNRTPGTRFAFILNAVADEFWSLKKDPFEGRARRAFRVLKEILGQGVDEYREPQFRSWKVTYLIAERLVEHQIEKLGGNSNEALANALEQVALVFALDAPRYLSAARHAVRTDNVQLLCVSPGSWYLLVQTSSGHQYLHCDPTDTQVTGYTDLTSANVSREFWAINEKYAGCTVIVITHAEVLALADELVHPGALMRFSWR